MQGFFLRPIFLARRARLRQSTAMRKSPKVAADISPAMQDYLKACHRLQQREDQPVSLVQLAGALEIAPPSVTNMVKRLGELRLMKRVRGGVVLTTAGHSVALEVVRHHRLLETFLVNELGMDWAEAHSEAEVLEHYISERLEAIIAKRMHEPTHDPQGKPIPPG